MTVYWHPEQRWNQRKTNKAAEINIIVSHSQQSSLAIGSAPRVSGTYSRCVQVKWMGLHPRQVTTNTLQYSYSLERSYQRCNSRIIFLHSGFFENVSFRVLIREQYIAQNIMLPSEYCKLNCSSYMYCRKAQLLHLKCIKQYSIPSQSAYFLKMQALLRLSPDVSRRNSMQILKKYFFSSLWIKTKYDLLPVCGGLLLSKVH